MSVSITLEILSGAHSGLPALVLVFDGEEDKVPLKPAIKAWEKLSPPPAHVMLRVAADFADDDAVMQLLQWLKARASFLMVDLWAGWQPWMAFADWRRIHENTGTLVHPAEEIVFHTARPPVFRPWPVHLLKPPVLYWAPEGPVSPAEVPPGFRLWTPAKPKLLWKETKT